MTELIGGRQLADKFKKITSSTKSDIEDALTTSALGIVRDYKLNVNQAGLVDTGLWINTITFKEDDFGTNNPSVQIGSTIKEPPYPKLHEFGTSKFPATPTLFPAFQSNKNKVLKNIAKALRKGSGM